ncbi:hypothetical protein Tco_0701342 [Tanacetum coccineum]
MILIMKTVIMDLVMQCTTLPSHSESLKRFLFHFSRRSTRCYWPSHSEIVDHEKVLCFLWWLEEYQEELLEVFCYGMELAAWDQYMKVQVDVVLFFPLFSFFLRGFTKGGFVKEENLLE